MVSHQARNVWQPASPVEAVALQILLHAYERSQECQRDPWQFAMNLDELQLQQIGTTELRALVSAGLVEHAAEIAGLGDRRRFRRENRLSIHAHSCFILTAAGIEEARRQREAGLARIHTGPTPVAARAGRKVKLPVPRWDETRRQLWYAGELLLTFHKAAPLQELILTAFQELHWAARIDDPLPGDALVDAKDRLHDAIYRLNQHLRGRRIRFRGDGSGTAILWDRV